MPVSIRKFASFLIFMVIWAAHTTAFAGSASPAGSANATPVSAQETVLDVPSAWKLIDHTGRRVDEDDFRGRFRLVVFGYTFCPDVCPTGLLDVTEVMDRLEARARFVLPVFVTIDPNRDTPEVLAEYVANFHPNLVGLTGPEAQIATLREAYGVVSIPGPKSDDGTYFLAHSARKYLLAPGGQIITTFSHDAPPEVLERYLKELFQKMGV